MFGDNYPCMGVWGSDHVEPGRARLAEREDTKTWKEPELSRVEERAWAEERWRSEVLNWPMGGGVGDGLKNGVLMVVLVLIFFAFFLRFESIDLVEQRPMHEAAVSLLPVNA